MGSQFIRQYEAFPCQDSNDHLIKDDKDAFIGRIFHKDNQWIGYLFSDKEPTLFGEAVEAYVSAATFTDCLRDLLLKHEKKL